MILDPKDRSSTCRSQRYLYPGSCLRTLRFSPTTTGRPAQRLPHKPRRARPLQVGGREADVQRELRLHKVQVMLVLSSVIKPLTMHTFVLPHWELEDGLRIQNIKPPRLKSQATCHELPQTQDTHAKAPVLDYKGTKAEAPSAIVMVAFG